MTTHLLILNGPNLNLLGEREPEIYGATTLATIEESCQAYADVLGAKLDFRQSNYEGQLVDWVHEVRHAVDAIIVNPAGLSFHSIPLLDALKVFSGPIMETHISNIHARDEHHRHSILSSVATGVICGLGPYGYIIAMQAAAHLLGTIPNNLPEPIRIGPA